MMCFTRALLVLFINLPAVLLAQPVNDYLKILKNAEEYNRHDSRKFPSFVYQDASDSNLVKLRKKYNLDSIAGYSNEESRALNLMHWVHNTIDHNGVSDVPVKTQNADAIITLARQKGIGVTCRELATVLNDFYLAMGWKARKVYCYPKDSTETDADFHVLNIVYISSLKKWILTDPTSDAYIMNRNGQLLSIEEVRKCLIYNTPFILNPEANLNRHESVTEDEYINYLTKNLYLFYCPLKSEYDYETRSVNKEVTYVYLVPLDYKKTREFQSEEKARDAGSTNIIYRTNNPIAFWLEPIGK